MSTNDRTSVYSENMSGQKELWNQSNITTRMTRGHKIRKSLPILLTILEFNSAYICMYLKALNPMGILFWAI